MKTGGWISIIVSIIFFAVGIWQTVTNQDAPITIEFVAGIVFLIAGLSLAKIEFRPPRKEDGDPITLFRQD